MPDSKKTFGTKVLDYYLNLKPDIKVPEGVEILYPYDNKETITQMKKFYSKFYSDKNKRIQIFGINPGRFGAGITGVPFYRPY